VIRNRRLQMSAGDVINRIRTELDSPASQESPFARRMSKIRALQRNFREAPVGGRLTPLKRVFYWFTASAFDRQAKVVEALIEVTEELGRENERLTRELIRGAFNAERSEYSSTGHEETSTE